MALAYRLALRVAPDPWALGAALAVGLSPPFLAYGSAVYPELAAGAALAGAALLALRLRERVARLDAFACFALLGALPWLGTKFVPAGVVIGALAVRALWRAPRRTLAVGAVEVSLFSVALYVAFNEALYGGPTPYAADVPGESATDAGSPGGYLERSYRLVALFIDRDYGLLRWAPVFALAFVGLWWLWRSHRERLAQRRARGARDRGGGRAVRGGARRPARRGRVRGADDVRLLVPAASPAGRRCRWRCRSWPWDCATCRGSGPRSPRSRWLARRGSTRTCAGRGGSFATDRPDAPFGPLTDAFPRFEPGGGWPFWLAGAVGVAVLLLVLREAREARHSRQTAGATRARYSG